MVEDDTGVVEPAGFDASNLAASHDGPTLRTLATFLTGSRLLRFDALTSGRLIVGDDWLDDETGDLVAAILFASENLLSLDEFVRGVESPLLSLFGIFGNCTRGESLLGTRGLRSIRFRNSFFSDSCSLSKC